MKFDRVLVQAFGTLQELDTYADLPNLVIILGPNESGKSTFFEALTTALYGFRPAHRDRHPHSPWNGTAPEVTAWLRKEDDSVISVTRRLLKSATGRLTGDSGEQVIRNRPIPEVVQVPRDLFRQVYALTLSELAHLDEEAWEQLQERLLSGMGARDLVLARSAAEVLEEEAQQLWRPNRRGNQKIRDLRQRIGDRLTPRREAVERDRQIRRVHRERDEARQQLTELRGMRERTRLIVERASVLGPLKRRLDRIVELESLAHDGADLSALPSNPRARLSEIAQQSADLESRLERVAEDQLSPREAIERFTPTHKLGLGLRKEIGECQASAAEAESGRARIAQLEQELNDLDRRVASISREVFGEPLSESAGDVLDNLPVGEVGSRVDRRIEAQRRLQLQEMGRPGDGPPSAPWEPVLGLGLLALGIAFLTVAVGRGVGVAGGLLAAGGSAVIARWWSRRPSSLSPTDPSSASDMTQAKEAVRVLLEPLPLRPRDPDRELVAQLTRIQELRSDRRVRQRALQDVRASVQAAGRSVAGLGRRLGLPLPAHPGPAAHHLDRFLTAAERADEAASAATREMDRLEREKEGLEGRQNTLRDGESKLLAALGKHGDGDSERGLEVVEARLEAGTEAVRLRRELGREHHDLADLEARLRRAEEEDESWLMDDKPLFEAKRSVESLTERIERIAAEEEGATRDLRHLADAVTTDEVDGQIAAMEEELAQLALERDRKTVLAAVLRAADRRFREENEPDVLRKAGEYLSRITHSRYTELVAGDDPESITLQVVDPQTGRWVTAEQLSSGAREQIYLSLRLAAMDHLDEGGERLPVLVDEAFVNWDPARRSRMVDLLGELTVNRQVIIFTCHPQWADTLAESGGRIIKLEAC